MRHDGPDFSALPLGYVVACATVANFSFHRYEVQEIVGHMLDVSAHKCDSERRRTKKAVGGQGELPTDCDLRTGR